MLLCLKSSTGFQKSCQGPARLCMNTPWPPPPPPHLIPLTAPPPPLQSHHCSSGWITGLPSAWNVRPADLCTAGLHSLFSACHTQANCNLLPHVLPISLPSLIFFLSTYHHLVYLLIWFIVHLLLWAFNPQSGHKVHESREFCWFYLSLYSSVLRTVPD